MGVGDLLDFRKGEGGFESGFRVWVVGLLKGGGGIDSCPLESPHRKGSWKYEEKKGDSLPTSYEASQPAGEKSIRVSSGDQSTPRKGRRHLQEDIITPDPTTYQRQGGKKGFPARVHAVARKNRKTEKKGNVKGEIHVSYVTADTAKPMREKRDEHSTYPGTAAFSPGKKSRLKGEEGVRIHFLTTVGRGPASLEVRAGSSKEDSVVSSPPRCEMTSYKKKKEGVVGEEG